MAEQMKPSGIDWIGDIPESWNVKPLKYLAKCNQDVLLETTAPDYSFRYVDIGSVTYERGITGYQELRFEDSPSRARRKVSVGDTIISTVRTYLKAIAIISDSENVIVSTGFAVYTPDKAIYPQYLYYFCKSEGFVQEIDKNSYGIAYPAINTDLLSRICIAYPCYEEQQAIADFLDKECAQIDSITADLEKQIELLQQYKKSLITETVTRGLDKSVPMKDSGIEWIGEIPAHWDVKRFKDECSKIGDIDHYMPDSTDEGIPYIMTGDFIGDENNIDFVNCKRISREDYIRLSKKMKPMYGDILLARYATIGTVRIVDIHEEFLVSYACAIIRIKESSYSKYIYYYLKSNTYSEEISQYIKTNTQANVGIDSIGRAKVPVPPIEEQKQISEFLDKKCHEINLVLRDKEKQLLKIQQHKKSLIYEYVTGKKRVKEVQ